MYDSPFHNWILNFINFGCDYRLFGSGKKTSYFALEVEFLEFKTAIRYHSEKLDFLQTGCYFSRRDTMGASTEGDCVVDICLFSCDLVIRRSCDMPF